MSVFAAALLFALCAQSDPADLVDRLGSDLLDEREEATRQLKVLGKAAAVPLERAARSEDPEVAGRAQLLLRRIAIQDRISPRLQECFPGLADRLLAGDAAWKDVLFEGLEEDKLGNRRRPALLPADLEFLAAGALRGCATSAERIQVCSWVVVCGLKGATDELLRVLGDADPAVRSAACHSLAGLGAASAVPAIARLLEDPVGNVRARAAWALADLKVGDQATAIARLVVDPERQVRCYAAASLRRLGALESGVAPVRSALADREPAVRLRAIEAAMRTGERELVGDLRALLQDADEAVRVAALEGLRRLETAKK